MRYPVFSTIHGHTCFCPPLRKSPPFLIDLGGNRGEFSHTVKRLFGGTGIVIEPNPNLNPIIASKLPERTVINAAVSSTAGKLPFHVSTNDQASSLNTLPDSEPYGIFHLETVEVNAITLDQLLARPDLPPRIDLMKVDIEGAEVDIFHSPPQALFERVAQICVEFHSAPQFGYDLREPTLHAVEALRALGFRSIDWTNGELTDVLFINSRLIRFFPFHMRMFQIRESAARWKNRLTPR